MSGIFGLVDPAGADPARVVAAAGTVPRGEPAVWCDGPWALGHYVEPLRWSSLDVGPDAVTVVDGRIDAGLPGTAAAKLAEEHDGHGVLASVLAAEGGSGLAGLAADFAVARLDCRRQVLLLSRDAFGMRPLFCAGTGRGWGFASDPDVLLALGLASGELDRNVISSHLAQRDIGGERTAFVGVSRFPGGRWREFDLSGLIRDSRWFRPEDIPEQRSTLDEAAEALRAAVQEAVVDRVRGRRAVLFLSGGRDSGAVAVAAARASVPVTCLTKAYPPELGCSEEDLARGLANAVGLECHAVPMPTGVTQDELAALPAVSGTPLGLPCPPEVMAMRRAIDAHGPAVVLDGEGGDVLFTAGPVALLDLARRGRFRDLAPALRWFSGLYSPWTTAKTVGRSLAPAAAIRARDRARRPPTWVVDPPVPESWRAPPRTTREQMLRLLAAYSVDVNAELYDRLAVGTGSRWASPLLDQRVVRIAVGLPVEHRAPAPGPKPLLAKAFLGPLDGSRRKTSFHAYYAAVGRELRDLLSAWCIPGMLAMSCGFVHERLGEYPAALNEAAVLRCVGLEAWLRRELDQKTRLTTKGEG